MRYVVEGMNDLPGRKLMMLFSDGFDITQDSSKSRTSVVYEMLQDLVEYANRSSVVVYTFETRGLKSMSIQASDSTYEIIDGHRGQKEKMRTDDFKDKQDGLVYLAKQTGGQALLDSNDLNWGIQRSLDEQAGYYLLAYVPSADSFDASKRKFNKLEVKVKQPGLKVAYRTGFFSTAPADTATAVSSNQAELVKALTSPFSTNQISVNSNSMFVDEPTGGTQMRSFLHIDPKDLTFSDAPDGWKTASFNIVAVAFGNNGVVLSFRGEGPLPEMRNAYFAADYLVHPTFYDPCSLVVLEALACGLPVITPSIMGPASCCVPCRKAMSSTIPMTPGGWPGPCCSSWIRHGDIYAAWQPAKRQAAGLSSTTTGSCSRCFKRSEQTHGVGIRATGKSVPDITCATVSSLTVAQLTDRTRKRGPYCNPSLTHG